MENTVIPKVIHYCWFGGNPLPESAKRCIASWEEFCPGYEIKRWDESNYDVNTCSYAKEAYADKKWAFVSDYARFDILYAHGGVYFDTDVELVAPIDDILAKGAFLGMERNLEQTVMVAPGLGMAAPAGMPIYKTILAEYRSKSFLREDGTNNQTTVVKYTTDLLRRHGLQENAVLQHVADIWIYPWDFFCPMMYQTGELTLTENTRSIHHYDASWFAKEEQRARQVGYKMIEYFGVGIGRRIGRLYSLPYRVRKKIEQKGLRGAVCVAVDKLKNK